MDQKNLEDRLSAAEARIFHLERTVQTLAATILSVSSANKIACEIIGDFTRRRFLELDKSLGKVQLVSFKIPEVDFLSQDGVVTRDEITVITVEKAKEAGNE